MIVERLSRSLFLAALQLLQRRRYIYPDYVFRSLDQRKFHVNLC